jgi:hypothetical protein
MTAEELAGFEEIVGRALNLGIEREAIAELRLSILERPAPLDTTA